MVRKAKSSPAGKASEKGQVQVGMAHAASGRMAREREVTGSVTSQEQRR
jgi:hypothetical protein